MNSNSTARKPYFDLSGQLAVVTGGSRGLGQYMARALAAAGADVVVSARRAADCNQTVSDIRAAGRKAWAFDLDVRREDSISAFAAAVSREAGSVQILVNNAGCNVRKPVTDVTWDDWSTVVDTNLRGSFFVTKAFVGGMIERSYGRIINVGSVTTVFGYGGIVPYCASRGGVLQMTRAMAAEFGEHGITVNCVAPGWFRTEQVKVLYEDQSWVDQLVERIPVNRPGHPNDLDGAVVFLSSREAEYVTGQNLLVDGGITTGAMRVTPQQAGGD